MKLTDLHIHHLRNIQNRRFALHPSLNFIEGVNGSGKTSFLEALYLGCTGRSFRSREVSHLVSEGESQLNVFIKTDDAQTLSLQKSLHKPMVARINQNPCTSTSELARFLPCQLLYQDIFHIIDAGPGIRRGLLDWGLFHVEHEYHLVLKEYRRVLQQRNALLKQTARPEAFEPWNHLLASLAEKLDKKRQRYFEVLHPIFLDLLASVSKLDCKIVYFKGWDRKNEGKSLESILKSSWQSDRQRQFTQHGAHQADLLIETGDKKVKHYLSRGQQKMLLFALKFAQLSLLQKDSILVLVDDMFSELDRQHGENLLRYIATQPYQFFLTFQPENCSESVDGLTIHL